MHYLRTHPLLCIRPHSLLSPQGHHTSNCPFTNINLYWIISSEYKLAVIPHILENKTKNLLLTPPTPPVTSIFQYYFTAKLVERFANSNSASVTLSQTYSNSDTALIYVTDERWSARASGLGPHLVLILLGLPAAADAAITSSSLLVFFA